MHAGFLTHAPPRAWAGGRGSAPYCHHGLRVVRHPHALCRPAPRPAPAHLPLVSAAAAGSSSSSGGGGGDSGKEEPGCPSPEVQAYLRQHGVDLAQRRLVRQEEWGRLPPAGEQQPDPALSYLTLPLARLLTELMAGREGVQLQPTSPTAGEYAARLVFLAREVRLPVKQIRQKYVQQPSKLQFSVASALSNLQWLQQHLSPADVQKLARNFHQVWVLRLDGLQATKKRLQQLLSLSGAQWAQAVNTAPHLLYSPATAGEMAAWLQQGPARLNWGEVRELFRTNPILFSLTSTVVESKLRLITDLCGLGPEDVKYVVARHSTAFSQSDGRLRAIIATLLSHGFTGRQVAKMLRSARLLFTLDVEGRVLPLLAELERLLGGDRDAAIAVATKGGSLLGASAELLRFNFGWLVTHGGLSDVQARALLRRAPVVFTYDFVDATFQTKLAYWQALLGIPLPELLERHATYLKEGLAKVDRRVYTMEQHGELHRLLGTPSWSKISDKAFEKRYGVALVPEEDEGWRASPRVEQYGLLNSKKATTGYIKVPKAWQQQAGSPP